MKKTTPSQKGRTTNKKRGSKTSCRRYNANYVSNRAAMHAPSETTATRNKAHVCMYRPNYETSAHRRQEHSRALETNESAQRARRRGSFSQAKTTFKQRQESHSVARAHHTTLKMTQIRTAEDALQITAQIGAPTTIKRKQITRLPQRAARTRHVLEHGNMGMRNKTRNIYRI